MSPHSASDFRETNRVLKDEVIAKRDFSALIVFTHATPASCRPAPKWCDREQVKAFWQQAVAGLGNRNGGRQGRRNRKRHNRHNLRRNRGDGATQSASSGSLVNQFLE
jgi:hypothetical protein